MAPTNHTVSHLRIFGSEVLVDIPKGKGIKSDFQCVWRGILTGYSNETVKHYRTWAPETKQVLVVGDPFIDESVQGAKLLLDWPLEPSLKRKAAGEPKPRGRPKKRLQSNRQMLSRKTQTQRTQKQSSPNETAPKTNGEQAMSIAETTSKIHEPNTYEEAVSDPIQSPLERSHRRRITKPRNHHTWEYEELPIDRRVIGSKWVFRVKYHPDGSVSQI